MKSKLWVDTILSLYPSKDEINLLGKLWRRNRQSISVTVRKAVDGYFQNKSWEVKLLPILGGPQDERRR